MMMMKRTVWLMMLDGDDWTLNSYWGDQWDSQDKTLDVV